MDDKKLELKATAYAEAALRSDAMSCNGEHFHERLERAVKAAYIDGFRAGELESSARRTETEAA